MNIDVVSMPTVASSACVLVEMECGVRLLIDPGPRLEEFGPVCGVSASSDGGVRSVVKTASYIRSQSGGPVTSFQRGSTLSNGAVSNGRYPMCRVLSYDETTI